MSVLVQPSTAMKPLLATGVPTFTMNASPSRKDDVDMQIVYISDILKDGKDIRVKPLCMGNKDSFVKAKIIAGDKSVSGIEMRADGVYMRVHEGKEPSFGPETVVSLEYKDRVVSLGTLKGTFSYNDEDYKAFLTIYGRFIGLVKETIANAKRV